MRRLLLALTLAGPAVLGGSAVAAPVPVMSFEEVEPVVVPEETKRERKLRIREERRALKEQRREERRQQILDAAEKVFFSKGVAAATMDEVAAEAELSKGTLYLYFKSKDEIILSIFERLFSREFAPSSGK